MSAGGTDFIEGHVMLTFTPEILKTCFNVIIVDDNVYEQPEEFFVNITTTDPMAIISPMTTVVTIVDDDGKGEIEYKILVSIIIVIS